MVVLVTALAGSGFGVWLAQSSATLLPDSLPIPQTNVPPMAGQAMPREHTAAPAQIETASPRVAAAAQPNTAPAHDDNAAEYVGAAAADHDAEWDREWLAEMNDAVSVAALEEHLSDDASATPPADPPTTRR